MGMPSGSSPQDAEAYYHYMTSQHQTEGRVNTWTVDWLSLAWLWGFAAAISLVLILWVWQYRSTRQKSGGIYPVDTWSGYATELAGPATFFFLVLSGILTAFAIVLIIGHIVNGQIF
jgi:hypothetical protein